MSVLSTGIGASGIDTGDIGHSLRFRGAQHLSRTFSTPTDNKRCTLSVWLKKAVAGSGTAQYIMAANTAPTYTNFGFVSGDQLLSYNSVASVNSGSRTTTELHRDSTGWNHYLLVYDTPNATAEDRMQLWKNGVRITAFSASAAVALNANPQMNSATFHHIGAFAGGEFFNGYMARVCFVDGQALTPSSFGYQNTEINEWVTKTQAEVKAVVDAGGTNSFMLDFDDPNFATYNVGKDFSSKNNHWTPTNISLTAGSTYDWMLDVPGNSYATLNPLMFRHALGHATKSEANLKTTNPSGVGSSYDWSTVAVSSGKWYAEGVWTTTGTGGMTFGVDSGLAQYSTFTDYACYLSNGTKTVGASNTAYGATYAVNDVIGIALDKDANTVTFYKNNVSQGAISLPTTTVPMYFHSGLPASGAAVFNFGQRPFAYTPPTGFKALCQANMADPAILNPELHHNVVLDTGANIKTTSEAVYPSNFLEWIKDRANSNNHQLIDTVRGSSAVLQSNTTAAETTYTAPSGNSVGWAWKAGGAPVANNDGTIPAQVSANVDAGFSIVTYTGTGANATVGHGLGKAPGLVVVKKKAGGTFGAGYSDWCCYHKNQNAAPASGGTFLNLTNAFTASALYWNSTVPTSSVFSVGTSYYTNGSSAESYVAYCFAEIPGFSKIGSYTGNGSADGPFVHLGFKPKFVMIKRTDSTGSWQVFDSIRAGYNVDNDQLVANTSAAEVTTDLLDLTANGFKLRSTSTEVNASSGTYIFLAFADVPAKYSLAR